MKWQIAELIKEQTKEIQVDEEVDFSDAVRQNPDIKNMSKVHVKGKGFIDTTTRTVAFDLTIKGKMTLSCALTLDDVSYPYEATISPTFTWDLERYDENYADYLIKDTIELASVIWQEIFIQIPLRVVKDGAYDELDRQGIEILTAEDLKKETEITDDPRFSVLKGLKFEK